MPRQMKERFEIGATEMVCEGAIPGLSARTRYGDGFARRHNGAADASAALRPSACYRAFAPLRAITSG
jgi:hypothetical protein